MTDLFASCRDIASCPWTKQSHPRKYSNGKLLTSTLVNDRTLRSTADFTSALSNNNKVTEPSKVHPISHQHSAMLINFKISDLLKFLVTFLFSYLCSRLENHMKTSMGRFFFEKLLVEVSFHFPLQLCKNMREYRFPKKLIQS